MKPWYIPSVFGAFCAGLMIGAFFIVKDADKALRDATHDVPACKRGCRTKADETCEAFRRLLRAEPLKPGQMGYVSDDE